MNIAILLTCFNRKKKTISCLRSLYSQTNINFDNVEVFLVDDGSTDGTFDAVEKEFPSVNLVSGSGDLYWNGGMRLAWSFAEDKNVDFDAFVWLNDDVELKLDSLSRIVEAFNSLLLSGVKVGAICGAMTDSHGNVTYGGQRVLKGDRLSVCCLPIDNDYHQLCDTINGNFVLVSKHGYQEIGNLCPIYSHQMGDFDYGFRLSECGFINFQLKGIAGICESNSVEGTFRDLTLPFTKRLSLLKRPNQIAPVDEWNYFILNYSQRRTAFRYIKSNLRKHFPSLWLLLFGR
ncbi:glycosyltransferase family 2 protein [Vibrio cholerae]|nr:glycosyltransferase family 2 protein [Vibrio cholerae]